MNNKQEVTVGAMVAEDYRMAVVFNKYGIDFCCNGNRTIDDACITKGISLTQVIADIETIIKTPSGKEAVSNYNSWPLDLLADYIERKHHRYIKEQIPILKDYLNKIYRVHSNKHPELLRMRTLFNFSAIELSEHMRKEERMLFPYIRQMVLVEEEKGKKNSSPFGTIQNLTNMMSNEHEAEGQRFRIIRELTNNYMPPDDSCNTYRATYSLLEDFESDLRLHIHLENNILFPKTVDLEKKLSA